MRVEVQGDILQFRLWDFVHLDLLRYHLKHSFDCCVSFFQIRHVIIMHWKEFQVMNEKTEPYEDTNFWCLIYWTLMDGIK